ncbi:Zona pellucida sperm-binding protein 2 [Liparis tanakae]|uniref:Zona pellucida sperm-binding protein 2 n=1 Tax=Liparis tanakae TaxID=230148 RepID=A0A4Z2FU38_9TELE|nr:Zona pellucida sperm-binding protein 2 [Liparis tanakae]
MTVVTTLTSTWPAVQPDRITLLDPTCGPKETDGSRVLFEFKVDSCGTRTMVGESYVVYENQILYDRRLVADGPNLISRESQFKLTVRCFYPLTGVNRLSMDRIFSSETSGVGSVKVFESLKDSLNKLPAEDCLLQETGNPVNIPTKQVYQTTATGGVLPHPGVGPRPKTGTNKFIPVPRGHKQLLHSSQNLNMFPDLNLVPPPEGQTTGINVPLQVLAPPDLYINSGRTDENPALSSSSRIPNSTVVERFESNWGSADQTPTPEGTWEQPTLGQNTIVKPNEDMQSLKMSLSPGIQEQIQQLEASLDMSLYRPLAVEMTNTQEMPGSQPQSKTYAYQASWLHPVLQPPSQSSPDHIGRREPLPSSRDQKYISANPKGLSFENTTSTLYGDSQESVSTEPTSTSQVTQHLQRPGTIERRDIETVQAKGEPPRVEPLRKFDSSGQPLHQKPVVQRANSHLSNPSQYATGMTADGNHWMSQQLPEHQGLNGGEHLPEKMGFSSLKRKRGVRGITVQPDQAAVIRFSYQSPNQQDHQQKLGRLYPNQKVVQSVAETGNGGYGNLLSDVPRPIGASDISQACSQSPRAPPLGLTPGSHQQDGLPQSDTGEPPAGRPTSV